MNRNKIVSLLLTLIFSSAPLSSLAEGLYAGIHYAFLKYQQTGLDEANPTVLGLHCGLEINDHIAYEARLGVGILDDSVNDTKFEADMSIGLYAKARILPNAIISPYVVGGQQLSVSLFTSGNLYILSTNRQICTILLLF